MITISIMLANIMQGLDNTILNVALPHIQGSLSASLDQIAWTLTSYIVCSAIMMPLTGWPPAGSASNTSSSPPSSASPSPRRCAVGARPRRVEGLVEFERDLDRSDNRGARRLPVQRAHRNHRRTVVPQPRPVEEHQFHRRYGADVCRRADHDRDARTVVDDVA